MLNKSPPHLSENEVRQNPLIKIRARISSIGPDSSFENFLIVAQGFEIWTMCDHYIDSAKSFPLWRLSRLKLEVKKISSEHKGRTQVSAYCYYPRKENKNQIKILGFYSDSDPSLVGEYFFAVQMHVTKLTINIYYVGSYV